VVILPELFLPSPDPEFFALSSPYCIALTLDCRFRLEKPLSLVILPSFSPASRAVPAFKLIFQDLPLTGFLGPPKVFFSLFETLFVKDCRDLLTAISAPD